MSLWIHLQMLVLTSMRHRRSIRAAGSILRCMKSTMAEAASAQPDESHVAPSSCNRFVLLWLRLLIPSDAPVVGPRGGKSRSNQPTYRSATTQQSCSTLPSAALCLCESSSICNSCSSSGEKGGGQVAVPGTRLGSSSYGKELLSAAESCKEYTAATLTH